jgi:hypothetical protein
LQIKKNPRCETPKSPSPESPQAIPFPIQTFPLNAEYAVVLGAGVNNPSCPKPTLRERNTYTSPDSLKPEISVLGENGYRYR